MFKNKYIVADREIPVVFPETLNHADVARALFPNSTIVGAGFCFIRDNTYVCYGKSVSLRVESRNEEDSKILNLFLGAVQPDY